MSAQFPGAIVSPRTIANRVGVVYDADNYKTFYAEDLNGVNDEIVAIENALGINLVNLGLDGWLPVATIPTLQATDDCVFTLRFGADMTAILAAGQKLRITQNNSIRYFFIVKVGAYTGGNTDVEVYGGTDYSVLDTSTYPITLPKISLAKAPVGFPLNPLKWTEEFYSGSGGSADPTNAWSNLFGQYLDIPIGLWDIDFQVCIIPQQNLTGGNQMNIGACLSNANNTAAYGRLMDALGFQPSANGTIRHNGTLRAKDTQGFTSKTRLYLNFKDETNTTSLLYYGSMLGVPTFIRARIAYL